MWRKRKDMIAMFDHLGFDEYFTIGIIILFALTPFVIHIGYEIKERLETLINKKLAPHGLRLKK